MKKEGKDGERGGSLFLFLKSSRLEPQACMISGDQESMSSSCPAMEELPQHTRCAGQTREICTN